MFGIFSRFGYSGYIMPTHPGGSGNIMPTHRRSAHIEFLIVFFFVSGIVMTYFVYYYCAAQEVVDGLLVWDS